MSSSEVTSVTQQASPVSLTVQALRSSTRITVINSQWERVAQEFGAIHTELPPGLYMAQFQVGTQIAEKPVRLAPGSGRVTIEGDVAFASASPLTETRTSHEDHQHWAAEISRNVRDSGKFHGELFVFVRDLEEQSEPDSRAAYAASLPAQGLFLRDHDGNTVVDFAAEGQHSPQDQTRNRWSGLALSLKPDSYRLGKELPDGSFQEMSVHISTEWQTQIFLTREMMTFASLTPTPQTKQPEPILCPNFNEASVFMSRLGYSFNPGAFSSHATEAARLVLERGHGKVAENLLKELMDGKFENPMHGLYALHILLQNGDMETARIVSNNLYSLIGNHPDLFRVTQEATPEKQWQIRSALDSPAAALPMLRDSLRLLVLETLHRPEAIPAGSLVAQITEAQCGSGMWLVWRLPRTVSASSGAFENTTEAFPPPMTRGGTLTGASPDISLIGTVLDINERISQAPKPQSPPLEAVIALEFDWEKFVRTVLVPVLVRLSSLVSSENPEDLDAWQSEKNRQWQLNRLEAQIFGYLVEAVRFLRESGITTGKPTEEAQKITSILRSLSVENLVKSLNLPLESVVETTKNLVSKLFAL